MSAKILTYYRSREGYLVLFCGGILRYNSVANKAILAAGSRVRGHERFGAM